MPTEEDFRADIEHRCQVALAVRMAARVAPLTRRLNSDEVNQTVAACIATSVRCARLIVNYSSKPRKALIRQAYVDASARINYSKLMEFSVAAPPGMSPPAPPPGYEWTRVPGELAYCAAIDAYLLAESREGMSFLKAISNAEQAAGMQAFVNAVAGGVSEIDALSSAEEAKDILRKAFSADREVADKISSSDAVTDIRLGYISVDPSGNGPMGALWKDGCPQCLEDAFRGTPHLDRGNGLDLLDSPAVDPPFAGIARVAGFLGVVGVVTGYLLQSVITGIIGALLVVAALGAAFKGFQKPEPR